MRNPEQWEVRRRAARTGYANSGTDPNAICTVSAFVLIASRMEARP
jgi:hypothetical protein